MKTPSYSRGVRALCRYTRESVNRVKLRELGGLKIFVRVLKSRSGVDRDLHDVIIQCIKNFAYDNTSLIVLQNEGDNPSSFFVYFCPFLITMQI